MYVEHHCWVPGMFLLCVPFCYRGALDHNTHTLRSTCMYVFGLPLSHSSLTTESVFIYLLALLVVSLYLVPRIRNQDGHYTVGVC